jgi:DNA polymerase III delta' subunit
MAQSITWKLLVGQERQKQVLSAAFANGGLGHAYLFTGDEGCGTLAAAVDLAMSCLCEAPGDVPCGVCSSCEKVLRNAHPDFNLIMPVSMQKEHRGSDSTLSAKGWDMLADRVRARIADPYRGIEERGQATIPVEWIREVNLAIGRGVIGNAMHVAIIAGIDLMNKESANALLKTLEEPPAKTLMILCTERPHDVLPTIASRCQIVRFGFLPAETIAAVLTERLASRSAGEGPILSRESIGALAESSQGSLGAALRMVDSPLDAEVACAGRFWSLIERGDWTATTAAVDEVARDRDFAFFEKLYRCFMYLIRTSFLAGVPGAQKYITTTFMPAGDSGRLDAQKTTRLVDACEEALRGLHANGNQGLILTDFLLTTSEILHGEEQQAG